MIFNCPNCQETSFYYPGFVAARFAYLTNITCILCGYEQEFNKTECLEYTMLTWRN